jgi:hypothetical protein
VVAVGNVYMAISLMSVANEPLELSICNFVRREIVNVLTNSV